MDLSLASTTAVLAPMPSYPGGQASARGSGNAATQDTAVATDGGKGQSATGQTRSSPEETQKALQEAAQKKDPGSEVTLAHGFAFEYEGKRQVMKVNNEKGVLIYQVPSKGQLALIAAEDSAQKRGEQIRLTA